MEGRSTQTVQMSGSCTDRNELCTNAGRPCHRDRQIVVEHELWQCELAQGHNQSIPVLDHEYSQVPSRRLWTKCAEADGTGSQCNVSRTQCRGDADFRQHQWSVEQQRAVLRVIWNSCRFSPSKFKSDSYCKLGGAFSASSRQEWEHKIKMTRHFKKLRRREI